MSVVRITVLIWWGLILTQFAFTGFGEAVTENPVVSRFEGTVTLVQPQRGLVVLQNQTNALAVILDLKRLALRPGDRIHLEGESAPVNLPTITAIPDYPDRPSGREWRSNFTAPTNWAGNFICRMRGIIHPPTSGYYRFWIASDDESELWLSSNADPARTRKIAFVPVFGWTLPCEWTKFAEQRSEPVFLEWAKSYYIEAVQVQRGGEDNLAVAWEGPELKRSVIAGEYLNPWPEGMDRSRGPGWTMTNGILREYWTNTFPRRGLGLTARTTQESILRMAAPRVTVQGSAPLPEPLRIAVEQPLAPEENFRWAEVEGVLDFVANNGQSLTLELTDRKGRMQVRVLDWLGTSLPQLANSRVKLQGVCESVRNEKGESVAGLLWIPQAKEIPLVKPSSAEWHTMRATRLADLVPPAPGMVRGQKVRVGGSVVESSADGSFVIQDQGCFYGYVSKDGTNWIQLGNTIEIPMSNSVYAGLAVCSRSNGILTAATFQNVRGLSTNAVNGGVGPILESGTAIWNDDRVTMSGSGDDIWLRRDSFQFLHEPLDGDGEIVARVNSVQNTDSTGWARAGLMIRESLSSGAKFALVAQTARAGATLQYRIRSDGIAEGVIGAEYRAPVWVKLVRRHHRVRVTSADAFAVRTGQSLDLVGFFDVEQGNTVLKQAFCEENATATTIGGLRPDVQLVSKYSDVSIRRLLVGPYLASDGFRLDGIRIEGTVTFSGSVLGKNCFFVQDETGAISVNVALHKPEALPQVGQRLRVSGHSIAGKYSPSVDLQQIDSLGWGELPEPVTRSVALSTESHGDGVWIELSGVVRVVRREGTMDVITPEGPMRVWINDAKAEQLERYVDAAVRLRGVMSLTLSSEPLLLVPSQDYVEMLEAPPADPFAVPVCSITNLGTFDPRIQMVHRVRVAGTVTWRQEQTLFLENEIGSARVQTVSVPDMNVGDAAEVTGFPGRGTHVPVLAEALVRKGGPTITPKPVTPGAEDLFSGRYDGRLIRFEAEILEQRRDKQRQVLELQIGRRIVEATLSVDSGSIARITVGSEIAVTGVCRWESGVTDGDEQNAGDSPRTGSVEILLRAPADVLVLNNPPWWTARRVLSVIGILIGILLVSAVWIYTLRRRVERRSRQLAAATARLAEETRNAAVLAERQRLAGEIHDSLQQGFTGIRLQLDAANSKLAESPEVVRRYLNTAQSMIQYSLAEVKSALWNWQSPLLKEADLATALNSIAKQIGGVSPTRVEFELSGPPQPLSPTVEHHLLRIAQEGVTNAIKHADAKSIHVVLDYTANAVRLTIRDDGRGFVPEQALDERGTHFGLSGLIGRARKLGTQLTISSEPGKGTSLAVVVPLGELSKPIDISGNHGSSSH